MSRKIIVGLLLLLTLSSFAQTVKKDSDSQLDSSYFMYSLGVAIDIGDKGMVSKGLTDDFHAYLSLSRNLLLGLGFYGTFYNSIVMDVDLLYYLFSVSTQYHFKSVGDGFFLQGDFGYALGFYINDKYNFQYAVSSNRFGFCLGIGYAVPVFQGVSLLLSLSYRSTSVCNYFGDIGFDVGVLW